MKPDQATLSFGLRKRIGDIGRTGRREHHTKTSTVDAGKPGGAPLDKVVVIGILLARAGGRPDRTAHRTHNQRTNVLHLRGLESCREASMKRARVLLCTERNRISACRGGVGRRRRTYPHARASAPSRTRQSELRCTRRSLL